MSNCEEDCNKTGVYVVFGILTSWHTIMCAIILFISVVSGRTVDVVFASIYFIVMIILQYIVFLEYRNHKNNDS